MRVLSVNVGSEREINNRLGKTGIYKAPQDHPVTINEMGLDGDVISDLENHGGVDQAVYLYGQPDYDWWARELGRELIPGMFGENLTISDLHSQEARVGDMLQIGGNVLLQFTAPRIPCGTFASRMGDPQFVKRFKEAERPGVYCRVIKGGPVRAGAAAKLVPYDGVTVPVRDLFVMAYRKDHDEQTIRRVLRAPLSERERERYMQQLAKFAQ